MFPKIIRKRQSQQPSKPFKIMKIKNNMKIPDTKDILMNSPRNISLLNRDPSKVNNVSMTIPKERI